VLANTWPAPVEERGAKVDYQVAAPPETRNAQLAPSENRSKKSEDRRMATEPAWLKGRNSQEGRRETYLTLTGLLMKGI